AQLARDDDADQPLAELEADHSDYFPLHGALERRQLVHGQWSSRVSLLIGEAEQAGAGGFGLAPDLQWAAGAYVMAGEISERRLGESAQAARVDPQALDKVEGYPPAGEGPESPVARQGRPAGPAH